MEYPRLIETARHRDMTTVFGGYNHQISCQEGQFYDMKNMTSRYFPILSPRKNRGIVKALTNPQGLLAKDGLFWIDNKMLYKEREPLAMNGVTLSDEAPKTLAKMGAYIIIMPDKVWYNVETRKCGYMENKKTIDYSISFSMCEADGTAIVWHDSEYYKENAPQDGDYLMSVNSTGKPSLKTYSATTGIWLTVASTYVQITADGIGEGFEKDDGIRITSTTNKGLESILVNEQEGLYSTNTYIMDRTDDSIVIPGILGAVSTIKEENTSTEEVTTTEEGTTTEESTAEDTSNEEDEEETENVEFFEFCFERVVPDMAYVTECNNRLWGCSTDGHEIYCCKLGDVKNWNCFRGISTDSWAATIGSDGVFTGAITYLGYPMFFKEDSFVKVAVSTTGGHQVKETKCRGVQRGSDRSLAILNETLYYKSASCVCGYNGSLPFSVSDDLGETRFYDAVAGTIGDRYYISMREANGEYGMFVYDAKNSIWCKEDSTRALYFSRHRDDLYYIDSEDKQIKSVDGTMLYDVPESKVENPFAWGVESGAIGYSSPDNKYVARVTLRITLELGTSVDFYLQYDSCGEWNHKFNMSGKGTKTFSVPIIPRRCDHFKFRISGKGDCKIHSITKTIEEGSET